MHDTEVDTKTDAGTGSETAPTARNVAVDEQTESEPEPEPEAVRELESQQTPRATGIHMPPDQDVPSTASKPPKPPMPAIGLRVAQEQQIIDPSLEGIKPETPAKGQLPGLKLELTNSPRHHEPTKLAYLETPQQLMMGTPRTPRGSIPFETDLLREQLKEQMLLTEMLRKELDASSVEAGVKQLRENWLLAEDRADRQRARLTEICLQQVPSLKRELAVRNSENSVLTKQVSELLDELHEATDLGRELVMATPRQHDINSVRFHTH